VPRSQEQHQPSLRAAFAVVAFVDLAPIENGTQMSAATALGLNLVCNRIRSMRLPWPRSGAWRPSPQGQMRDSWT
jgi:hypothetical protein